MARRVSCINSLKKYNLPKDLIFGLIQTVETEREGERGRVRNPSFSLRFTRFHRSKLGNPRIKDDLRDEGYAWVPESQDSAKVQGLIFHENREKAVSQESMPFEVGFFSYSGSFQSKGMCVSKEMLSSFFSPTL